MGLKGSKPKLSKEDLEFLKKNTNFTEEQIKEWYKGFVVSPTLLVRCYFRQPPFFHSYALARCRTPMVILFPST